MLAKHANTVLAAWIMWAGYCYIGYGVERESFATLCTIWVLGAGLCYWWVHSKRFSLRHGLWLGVVVRASLFFVTPELSQDFYRYIWDGHLLHLGVNPYQYTPNEWIQQFESTRMPHAQTLLNEMGELSANNHSNYPPLHQGVFYLATIFGDRLMYGIVGLRAFVLLGDVLVCYFGIKILNLMNLPKKRILWYVLNPLVVLELTASLHLEGLMLGLLLMGLHGFFHARAGKSIWGIGSAISLKLLPVLTLPIIIRYTKPFKKWVIVAGAMSVVLITFIPFVSKEMLINYPKTIGLWFTNFEFNGSWYYIIREVGREILGYNPIRTVGKILPWVSASILLILWIKHPLKNKQQFFDLATLSFCVYLFFATTVHPWYLVLPLGLSILAKYRFPFVWAALVVLSYSAYGQFGFKENLLLITTEYLWVYALLIWEVFYKKTKAVTA